MSTPAPARSAMTLSEQERSELLAAIDAWQIAASACAKATADELALRKAITDRWFDAADEGVNTLLLGDGRALKCELPINRSVSREQFDAARQYAAERHDTAAGAELLSLLDETFRMKPELSVGEWKKLTHAQRKMLADIVTEKPGTARIKVDLVKR